MGLALAYFGLRYNLPLDAALGPLSLAQGAINGPIGHAVDAFALVGTIAGIATTLGLRCAAALRGSAAGRRFGTPAPTCFASASSSWSSDWPAFRPSAVWTRACGALSELNLSLSFLLLGFVIIAGPDGVPAAGAEREHRQLPVAVASLSLRTFAYQGAQDAGWFGGWTIFYWAWWISWSPFVGMFIARISRGRTVREFIVGGADRAARPACCG